MRHQILQVGRGYRRRRWFSRRSGLMSIRAFRANPRPISIRAIPRKSAADINPRSPRKSAADINPRSPRKSAANINPRNSA
ncbi:MAG TPA: hypothetical protein VGK99_01315 [Acidobacteriota bacterium]